VKAADVVVVRVARDHRIQPASAVIEQVGKNHSLADVERGGGEPSAVDENPSPAGKGQNQGIPVAHVECYEREAFRLADRSPRTEGKAQKKRAKNQ
jgi:hypothetical protein